MLKNKKILIYSFIALGVYFFFENAPLFDGLLKKLEKSNGSYAIGYYILIKICVWFLLAFGSFGIIMFLYEMYKSKK